MRGRLLWVVAAVLIFAFALPGFAAKKVVIGISVGTLKEERWVREIDMFKAYAKKNGFDVVVQTAEDDAQKQVAQIENLITQGVDALIVQALDSEACGTAGNKAKEAGIPIVSYERLVRNGYIDVHCGFDAEKVGEVQASAIVKRVPKGNYIWLNGGPEEYLAHLYLKGQEKVLQPYIDRGDIKIVLHEWCKGWNPDEALKNTENGLSLAKNNVQAVIASNDNTAGAAITALAAQGLAGKVPISGQDADLSACQRIVEGMQTMTVYKQLIKLNTAAMQVAYALATHAKDPFKAIDPKLGRWDSWDNGFMNAKVFLVDVMGVDKDNINQTIIKDGFQTVENVYKNIPKSKWPKL